MANVNSPGAPASVQLPVSLLGDTLGFVELASHVVKRALDTVAVYEQMQKRASELVAPLLDLMVEKGVIAEKQKQAAAAMLHSHPESLQLLKSAVDKLVEERQKQNKTAGDLGRGVDADVLTTNGKPRPTKQGEYNSLESPFVGERTSALKESDKVLLRGIRSC